MSMKPECRMVKNIDGEQCVCILHLGHKGAHCGFIKQDDCSSLRVEWCDPILTETGVASFLQEYASKPTRKVCMKKWEQVLVELEELLDSDRDIPRPLDSKSLWECEHCFNLHIRLRGFVKQTRLMMKEKPPWVRRIRYSGEKP